MRPKWARLLVAIRSLRRSTSAGEAAAWARHQAGLIQVCGPIPCHWASDLARNADWQVVLLSKSLTICNRARNIMLHDRRNSQNRGARQVHVDSEDHADDR